MQVVLFNISPGFLDQSPTQLSLCVDLTLVHLSQSRFKLVIAFTDIVEIEKRMTAMIIPNAIQISTLHAKHFFASFLVRDQAYDQLFEIWKIARGGPLHLKSLQAAEEDDELNSEEEVGEDEDQNGEFEDDDDEDEDEYSDDESYEGEDDEERENASEATLGEPLCSKIGHEGTDLICCLTTFVPLVSNRATH